MVRPASRLRSTAAAGAAAAIAIAVGGAAVAGPATAHTATGTGSRSTVPATSTGGVLPAGFSDTLAASLPQPTAMAATPDGRMLVTTKAGQLRVIKGGALLSAPALDLTPRTCSLGERGLLGVAVDPHFATNHWIFLFYTTTRLPCSGPTESRISRFVLNGDTAAVGSEKVLADHIPSPRAHHLAGDLIATPGYLYATVGDGYCHYDGTSVDASRCAGANDNARSLRLLLGKVLRLTTGGAVPADNPYAASRRCVAPAGPQPGTGPCAEIYATGLRNPFRFALDPVTGAIHVNDVGQATWEEIDVLRKGADYGWNGREGFCAQGETAPGTGQGTCSATPSGYTEPIHAYSHAAGCSSITGAAFAPSSWPAPYAGSYFFADYVCGSIFRLVPRSGGGFTQSAFLSGLGASSAIALQTGLWQGRPAMFYATFGGGGQVRAIVATSANTAPIAAFTVRTGGTGNRTATLDGSSSYDPDGGDGVTSWAWTFGDGNRQTGTTPTVSHTYSTAGSYAASLVVTDSHGATSAPSTERVVAGNASPTLSIARTPATFAVNQSVTLRATAGDADGPLDQSTIRWHVVLHHRDHDHPLKDGTGRTVSFSYPAPEDFPATQVSYLQATASVTDNNGATTTKTRRLLPHLVAFRLASTPTGARLVADGTTFATPIDLVSWQGWVFTVSAPDQTISGVPSTFRSWSDGGAATHVVTTGGDTTLGAAFRAAS